MSPSIWATFDEPHAGHSNVPDDTAAGPVAGHVRGPADCRPPSVRTTADIAHVPPLGRTPLPAVTILPRSPIAQEAWSAIGARTASRCVRPGFARRSRGEASQNRRARTRSGSGHVVCRPRTRRRAGPGAGHYPAQGRQLAPGDRCPGPSAPVPHPARPANGPVPAARLVRHGSASQQDEGPQAKLRRRPTVAARRRLRTVERESGRAGHAAGGGGRRRGHLVREVPDGRVPERQLSPTTCPFSSMSMCSAAACDPRPGIVRISPQTG